MFKSSDNLYEIANYGFINNNAIFASHFNNDMSSLIHSLSIIINKTKNHKLKDAKSQNLKSQS